MSSSGNIRHFISSSATFIRTQEYESSPQAAFDDYIAAAGENINAAAAEIDELLAHGSDDASASILRRLDNNYNYEADGYTAQTWLAAIRDRLRA